MSCQLRSYSMFALILGIVLTCPNAFCYITVDGAVCLQCHTVGDYYNGTPDGSGLHAVIDHGTCTACHEGIPQKGTVAASSCSVCHGSECRTVSRHETDYAARCIKCHPLCTPRETDDGTDESECPVEAVYGPEDRQSAVLRGFRDRVLSQTKTGRVLIDTYYTLSPLLAAAIEESRLSRRIARTIFDAAAVIINSGMPDRHNK